MARVEVSRLIAAPVAGVWADLAALESHVEWMADAERITFLTAQRRGVGTRLEVATRIGPFRLADVMEFVAWDPPNRMAIHHVGLVTGSGEFVLEEEGGATRFTWREELRFPWYLGGRL